MVTIDHDWENAPRFGELDVGTRPVPLGQCRARYVRLQNRYTNSDNTPNQQSLYWGDATHQSCEIVPGQFTDWIPIRDIADIYVRTAAGNATVAWLAVDRV